MEQLAPQLGLFESDWKGVAFKGLGFSFFVPWPSESVSWANPRHLPLLQSVQFGAHLEHSIVSTLHDTPSSKCRATFEWIKCEFNNVKTEANHVDIQLSVCHLAESELMSLRKGVGMSPSLCAVALGWNRVLLLEANTATSWRADFVKGLFLTCSALSRKQKPWNSQSTLLVYLAGQPNTVPLQCRSARQRRALEGRQASHSGGAGLLPRPAPRRPCLGDCATMLRQGAAGLLP